ncbi:MAG TPA: diacylglycerol kinase family protein [Solirubrobacterales bacterium]|jgi:diacylglycerol kinase family enzyme
MNRRFAASLALLAALVAVASAAYAFVSDFPRGLVVFACIVLALGTAWMGLLRKGTTRTLWLVLAALLLAASILVTLGGGNAWALAVSIVAVLGSLAASRRAFRPAGELPPAPALRQPVLFVNPRSGDGRAARVGLAAAARERGIEVVELHPGEDLEQLVTAAVGRGADALAMAGGDGSQAVVATVAAAHDLAYACIPSGTRNHFALDLGVDREDVVGALDALLPGAGERYVDLGEVNGRVFVNNVSLGIYAIAVSQEGYREAKMRTLLDTLADALGPDGEPRQLHWRADEEPSQTSEALVLVSNNPYRLGPTLGSGTRPHLDSGRLGIVDFAPPKAGGAPNAGRYRELTARELTVEAGEPVATGIDGEAVTLESPLRFRIRPGALRVRIAPQHPGASPSSAVPRDPLAALRELGRLAFAP